MLDRCKPKDQLSIDQIDCCQRDWIVFGVKVVMLQAVTVKMSPPIGECPGVTMTEVGFRVAMLVTVRYKTSECIPLNHDFRCIRFVHSMRYTSVVL